MGIVLVAVPIFINLYSTQKQRSLLHDFERLKNKKAANVSAGDKKPVKEPAKKTKLQPYVINIPKIGLRVVVVEGTFQWDLAKGPGHIETSPQPGETGNVGISGHRTMYGAPFRHLDELRSGDLIYFETLNGKIEYKVTEKRKVLPTNVAVLKDFGDDRVTLTTCDPLFSASRRLVVVGKLIK